VEITQAIAELRVRNEPVPKPLRLPTEDEVAGAERELGIDFPPDYRRYLLEASDVVFSTKEPCVVTLRGTRLDLVTVVREAREMGVPRDWLPFCEDNGDYYCLAGNTIRYWSHNGETDEQWPDLGTWIDQVWIGEA
jgi:SMI1-KNR4 cell-wall